MNLRQLRTLAAIADQGSFTAAGRAVRLSHSAVSLQVKSLERELGIAIVDRAQRPPRLTARGRDLVEIARRMAALEDEIRALGSDQALAGMLSIGVVPTEMVHLLPPALAKLKTRHPRLALRVRSGLSSELAQAVRAGELDVAVATWPEIAPEGLALHEIAREPLAVIAPAGAPEETVNALVSANPFIWFSRMTWAGQQIERMMTARGLTPPEGMEADSLEAIVALVANGLGVSVVPLRPGAPLLASLRLLPIDGEDAVRRLALVERSGNPKARIAAALLGELRSAAGAAPAEDYGR
jgi:DNA-binding transcriptional LysR family regulator